MQQAMDDDAALFDIEVRLLIEAVFLRYQHDFRHYARASLKRRIGSAMERFDCRTVTQLLDRILHEPEVFAGMLQYFTVQVSDMFRDPSYFRSLRDRVIPELLTYPSVKVWVAGCSTGEELWSLVILFHEESLLSRTIFYATDINVKSLRAAEKAKRKSFKIESSGTPVRWNGEGRTFYKHAMINVFGEKHLIEIALGKEVLDES